jgi:hypothetical protein
MVVYKKMNWDNSVRSDRGIKMTHKQIVDAAIEASVRSALEAVGLDVIKSEPFFGMGERNQADLKKQKENK